MSGRHYLLTHDGRVYHKPDPCYLRTQEEAMETSIALRALYGGTYSYIDADVAPTCDRNYPGNGSNCERPFGHPGPCGYLEVKRNQWIEWSNAS